MPDLSWSGTSSRADPTRCTRSSRRSGSRRRSRAGQLLQAAAAELGGLRRSSAISDGVISAPNGKTVTIGSLAGQAAVVEDDRCHRAAEAAVTAHADRHPAAQDRRARHRHRPQAVRDGPRRPRRAADDGLPAADDQRHRARGQQPASGASDAGRSPTSRSFRTRRSSRAASPSGPRRSGSASTRSTPSTSSGARGPWTESPTPMCSRTSRRPSCR